MSSRTLLNLALLVIIAVLVAVLVYKPGEKAEPVIKLTSLAETAIHKIEIQHIGAPTIILEKQGDNWQMSKPYAIAADKFKAETVTELAAAKSTAQYPIKAGEDLKPYGLDIPRLTVIFNDKDKLQFGGTEPLKYQRYIRIGDTLHLIFDRFYYNLSTPAPEYVSHALLPVNAVITKLVLPKLSLTQQGNAWEAEPPIKQLSNDQVNELLDNWTGAHATQMLEYKPAKDSEHAQVYLKGQDKPLVFDVLHEKDAIALGRADLGLKYKFTEDVGNSLLSLPAKLSAETDKGEKQQPASPAKPEALKK
ncbi:MAG: DUF4340 domain-containing protein [Gammaproteobacteria bacterium]|nr:DUF4340 domain-containing protein [Gammaproteobacteria bacterium]